MAPQLPIFDREHETAVITEAVDEAASRRGRFLVIEGDAGIGKTRLLQQVRTIATGRQMTVLSARGSELESEFAFGIVRQLFEPRLDQIPLSGSAAGAAPVFNTALVEPTRAAELPILHGLYWLTVNVYRRPGVLLVDDLHWADAASLRYLAYLQPRLAELPVMVVVVLRSGEHGSDQALVRALLADSTATVLRPGPLSQSAVRELLRSLLDRDVDPAFAASCMTATAGNPLLLRALAASLVRDGVAPTMANQHRVTDVGRLAVSHLVSSRLARLPAPVRAVACAAAVLGPGAALPAVARLAEVDPLTATAAADELTRLGLLDDQSMSFVHPLVATAVYAELGARDRTLIHARAADVLHDGGEEPERVAAHLLKTVPGVGTDTVPRLRRAGAVALCRGSPEAALAYLRRCLAEDLDDAERLALLREAATVARQVDLHEAVRLYQEAGRYAVDPSDRARILADLGVAYGYLLDPDQACDALFEALRLLPDRDDDERRRIEATLLVAVFVAPGRRGITERLAGLKRLPTAGGLGARMLESAIAAHEMAACDPRGHTRARAALADGMLVRAAGGEGALVCGWLALLAADDPAALSSLEEAVGQAHLHGSLRELAPAYTFRGLGRLWTGHLAEAETDEREALRLAQTGRVDMDPIFAGAYLADALTEQGRLDEAETVLHSLGIPADVSPARPRYYALEAYARLIRRRGDPNAAPAALAAGEVWQAYGFDNPALGSWRSEAALALFATDDVPGALRCAEEELDRAERWGAPRALGRALRVLGQLTGGRDGLASLQRSVEILSGGPARLEYARSLAEWGAALRRAGRRVDARESLGRALEAAEICGAAPLIAQIRTESHAAGFRPRRHRLIGVDALTPSERRVAEIAAGGASNREIAQALFVTTKTVEVHLTSAYRKLGVRRRGELAHRLT